MIDYCIDKLRKMNTSDLLSNLRSNLLIPLLSIPYFLLYARLSVSYYIGIVVSFFVILFFSMVIPPLGGYIRNVSLSLKLLAFINAFGSCYCSWYILRYYPFIWGGSPDYLRFIIMFLALPFAWLIDLMILDGVIKTGKDILKKVQMSKMESLAYLLVFLVSLVFVSVFFLSSQAYYGTENMGDVIYTSDTPKFVQLNVFVFLNYIENDIRQPLFAVFSSPFMGFAGLVSSFFQLEIKALIMDVLQIALLIISNIFLAILIDLSKYQRICFVIASSCSYTCLLFSLMIEQYIVAYFWLVLALYLVCNRRKEAECAVCAAGGTLLTSLMLAPFICSGDRRKRVIDPFLQIVKTGAGFVILVLMLGRTDVLLELAENFSGLSKFTGEKVGFVDKILQYLNFIRGCFIAPQSYVRREEYASWQLMPVSTVSIAGLIILLIAVISFVITRHDRLSQISFCWILLSFAVLVIIGWGTAENGLVLYSLYFGWAFVALVYNFLKHLEAKTGIKHIVCVFSVLAGVAMLIYNIPALKDLFVFAVTEYPV